MLILLQNPGLRSLENLTVRQAARACKIPVRSLAWTRDNGLAFPREEFLPVGDADFCRAAFLHQEVTNLESYPRYPGTLMLPRFLPQPIEVCGLGTLLKAHWPITGWKVETLWRAEGFPRGVYASAEALKTALHQALPEARWPTRVQISEPLKLVSRWRYYVIDQEIAGASRYDRGSTIAPVPDLERVREAVHRLHRLNRAPAGFALDFGVLEDLRTTALLGARDGWALDLLPGSLHPEAYLDLLRQRHAQIIKEKRLTLGPATPLETW